jgi:hypothetical protein
LSAWFRLKYPHLVVGAVSTSAPLTASVDFPQYYAVVKKSLETRSGSGACGAEVAKAAKQLIGARSSSIVDSINSSDDENKGKGKGKGNGSGVDSKAAGSPSLAELSKAFNTCTPLSAASDNDWLNFVSGAQGAFAGVVQYNR